VYFNQSEAKKLGNRAKKDMEDHFSLETCGHRMVEHLNTLQ
jgi:hypothetical protein